MTGYFIFCAALMLMGAAVGADAATALEPETISIIAALLSKLGSFGMLEWVLVAHVVALIVVNVTETPEDNRIYGKLYKLLIEPLALGVGKAKQSPKQGFK